MDDMDDEAIPINKFKFDLLQKEKVNVCLILTGLFNPIHLNHIRALDFTKDYLTKNFNFNVVAGYIYPLDTITQNKKNEKSNLLSLAKRVEMIEKTIQDSDWINIDTHHLLDQIHNNIGISQETKRIETYLNSKIEYMQGQGFNIKIVQIFGLNNFDQVSKLITNNKVVLIDNRPNISEDTEFNIEKKLKEKQIAQYSQNIIYITDKESPFQITSTKIRNLLNDIKSQDNLEKITKYLHPAVIQLHKERRYQYTSQLQNIGGKQSKKSKNDAQSKQQHQQPHEHNLSLDQIIDNKLGIKYQIIPYSDLQTVYENDNQEEQKQTDQQSQKIMLGKGLQAKVFEMKWQNKLVAVKTFDISKDRGRKVKCFLRELRALQACNHKNVLKCYGVGMYKNLLYLVLERCFKFNLHRFLISERENWTQQIISPIWIKMLSELAAGLNNMSISGVLHRDLQINNILLFNDNQKSILYLEEINNHLEKKKCFNQIEGDPIIASSSSDQEEQEEKRQQYSNQEEEIYDDLNVKKQASGHGKKMNNKSRKQKLQTKLGDQQQLQQVQQQPTIEQLQQYKQMINSPQLQKADLIIQKALLKKEFTLKITDFGVSAFDDDKQVIVRGSMRHYSPEAIIDKNQYIPSSDVYSFANLIFEIINGEFPFSNCTVKEACEKVIQGQRPQFQKPCPAPLLNILNLCWQEQPEARPSFAKISQMLYELYIDMTQQQQN